MQSIDSDPQLFEGILLHNSPGEKSVVGDGPYSITVRDLRLIGRKVTSQEYGECLRGYMFNMPLAIVDTVAKMMKKTLDQKEFKTRNETPPCPSMLSIVDKVAKMMEKSLDQKEYTTSPTPHILSGSPPSYEEITENISRLMLEREKCVEAGLPTDDVDAELKRLQQKRKMLSSERYI